MDIPSIYVEISENVPSSHRLYFDLNEPTIEEHQWRIKAEIGETSKRKRSTKSKKSIKHLKEKK